MAVRRSKNASQGVLHEKARIMYDVSNNFLCLFAPVCCGRVAECRSANLQSRSDYAFDDN